ncbi:MAG: hypothetical protein AAGK47_08525, partial [Bacteroidota bacterium]
QQQAYEPRQLTKLNEAQLFERIKAGLDPYTADIIYKNQRGDILTNNNVVKMMMQPNTYAIDFFVDENQMIQEGVVRAFTPQDSIFKMEVERYFRE